MTFGSIVRQGLTAAAVVAATTAANFLLQANAATAGLVFFLVVLELAAWQGFLAGTLGSLLAAVCYNLFFFPPIGTLRIAEAHNWVSLCCFLLATTVASRLVARERQRALEAESRQREIAALYELCVDLFTASAKPGGLNEATSRALRTIGVQSGGLVLLPDGGADPEMGSWIGDPKDLETYRLLDRPALAQGALAADTDRSPSVATVAGKSKGWRNAHVPVLLGERVAGVLVAYGTRANLETLESVAKLIALAFERERFLAEQARLDGLQASDSLKSALLRAVSHDLTTPLTAILLSLESLKREAADTPGGSQTVDLIVEETTRLKRRIQNLLAMARLESGSFQPQREPTPPADLFRAARENLKPIAASRRIAVHVAEDCPDLDVDPALALEILVNLIENAHRASPSSEPIELAAAAHPSDHARVRVEVLDRGRGFSGAALRLSALGEPPSSLADGDAPRKGLGLEIARSFAAAHGCGLELLPREGGGACARLDLPAAGVAHSTASGGH